jgi:hypothetical protein
MVKKSRPTETKNHPVTISKNESSTPLPMILQTVEITQCTIERKIPRSLAAKGKVDTDLTLNIEIEDRDNRPSVVALLKAEIKGHPLGSATPGESFIASFVLEGLFYPEEETIKLAEEHLNRSMAERIVHELHPMVMLRASELLSMMGYGGVRLVYGLSRPQFHELDSPCP